MALGQEEIGRRIAVAREGAGLSQRELAERIGVADAQSISRYERGVTEVKQRRLEKIAEATGKPLSFFIEIPGDRASEENPATVEEIREVRKELAEVHATSARIEQMLRLLLERDDSPARSEHP